MPDSESAPAEQIEVLRRDVAACRICRDAPEGGREPLPHEPRPVCVLSSRARILIAGQAPGTRVHESGVPFTDPSGDRLRAWMGVGRETFYDADRIAILPMGFCFPGLDGRGSDLPPRPECAAHWHDRLVAAMPQVSLILVIGQYAQRYHLGSRRRRTMSETVAAWREVLEAGDGRHTLPLPHPSWRNTGWIRRHPWFEAELLPHLRGEVRRLLDAG